MDLGTLLGIVKALTPRVLLGIAIGCGALLFSPIDFLARVGLDSFQKQNQSMLGGALFLSLALLLAHMLASGWSYLVMLGQWILKQRKKKQRMQAREQMLHELTPDEKRFLIPFIEEDQTVIKAQIGDGVAAGLANRNVVYRPSRIGNILTGWDHSIQPWAKAYLKAHPELLEGASPPPRPRSDRF